MANLHTYRKAFIGRCICCWFTIYMNKEANEIIHALWSCNSASSGVLGVSGRRRHICWDRRDCIYGSCKIKVIHLIVFLYYFNSWTPWQQNFSCCLICLKPRVYVIVRYVYIFLKIKTLRDPTWPSVYDVWFTISSSC